MARILIASFGLTQRNTRLMPWRTVLEVAAGLRSKGHDVVVLSVADIGRPMGREAEHGTITIQREGIVVMRNTLVRLLGDADFDAMFIPVSLSHNRLMRELLHGIAGIRIAYLPGSVFEFRHLLRAIRKMPFSGLLPYIAQALFPKRLVRHALDDLRVRAVIANSDYSRDKLARHITQPVMTIAPGRDPVLASPRGEERLAHELHAKAPFFLFMGPPLPIRGAFVLLDAYLKIADGPGVPPLLCLFRSDAHLDIEKIKSDIERRWSHDKLIFVWSSLEPMALQDHIDNAVAIVMPFLVVPSEIPLAVYEAAGMGKTVITTQPHGTGDFVDKFGETVPVGDPGSLADALRRTIKSGSSTVNEKAVAAYQNLEDWETTARRWEAIAIDLGMPPE
ncbi:glycosyltransferase family 4 protein [Planctomycetota bacterium]|nr:glycosyltransferase family 4 protein [Planctomycetota bacterium]